MEQTQPVVFNPLDPVFRADPYPTYAALRDADPIHRSPIGFIVLSRYEHVSSLIRDPRMSSDLRNVNEAWFLDQPRARDRLERRSKMMLFADAPDHTRLRRLVSRAFTPRVVDELAPRVHEIASGLLDGFAERDLIDLIPDFAYALPVAVIAELLGVPHTDLPLFREWSGALARALDPFTSPDVIDEVERAATAFDVYFGELIEYRRASPTDDLISALAAAEEEGDRLSHEEVLSMCRLLLVAGHETTMNLIGNGVNALLGARDQLNLVRDDPSIVPSAITELLRFDSPVQQTVRVPLEDVVVDRQTLAAGDVCLLLLASGNRDPRRFDEPDRLDVARTDNKHLAFGGGAHFCLGAPLARLEAEVAIPALLQRFPRLALADAPNLRDKLTLRGLSSLPLRLR